MRYGVRFIDIGHMGHSDATLLSHGDEDDRASEREILTSAPALSERGHRRLARGLVSVRRSAPLAFPIRHIQGRPFNPMDIRKTRPTPPPSSRTS
jgi:hypothetical protein